MAADGGSHDPAVRGILFRVLPPQPLPVQHDDDSGDEARDEAGAAVAMEDAVMDVDAGEAGIGEDPEPNYVFATIHYGDPDSLHLHMPRLRSYLSRSRALINEVDLEESWQPEYEAYRRLESGQSLRRMLGDEAFALLVAQLPDTGPDVLDVLKPWVAMSMLEFPFDAGSTSIDALLQQWAADAGLARIHLENLPDQLAALDCVPAHEYARVLGQRLLGGWSFDLDAERTVGYYRERDLAAWLDDIDSMHGLSGAALVAEEEARRCLIDVRNDQWLPVLDRVLRKGGGFVAVGAIHLTGTEGLLAQLSRRGFRISVEPW